MRWRTFPPNRDRGGWRKTLSIAFTIVFWPLIAVLIAAFLMHAGAEWLKRKIFGPTVEWRAWLAWYPVRLDDTWPSTTVWLERVDRRLHPYSGIEYRQIERNT